MFDADAEHILKEPQRVIGVDDQQVLIHVKQFEGTQVSEL